jgi:hypothetical protein
VVGVITVIMPGEIWREDKIPRQHDAPLSIDCRIRALTFRNKTDSGRGVSMCGCALLWKQELDGGYQSVRSGPLATKPRVGKLKGSTLSTALDWDELARSFK